MSDQNPKVDTIYPDGDEWEACGTKTYPRNSVLAGQQQEIPIEWYPTLEKAKAAHPAAYVSDVPRYRGHRPMVSHCPPADFDPMDAGEAWSENDY